MGFYYFKFTTQYPLNNTLQTHKIVLAARPHYTKNNQNHQNNQTQYPINNTLQTHKIVLAATLFTECSRPHNTKNNQNHQNNQTQTTILNKLPSNNTLPIVSKFEKAVMAWDGLDLLYVVPVDRNVYLGYLIAWDLHVDKLRLSSCYIRGSSMIHLVPFP